LYTFSYIIHCTEAHATNTHHTVPDHGDGIRWYQQDVPPLHDRYQEDSLGLLLPFTKTSADHITLLCRHPCSHVIQTANTRVEVWPVVPQCRFLNPLLPHDKVNYHTFCKGNVRALRSKVGVSCPLAFKDGTCKFTSCYCLIII
jgi:hypothetical protein